MTYTYALVLNSTNIQRSDGVYIPADPLNADYAAYLAWVASGNTVTPVPAAALLAQQVAVYEAAIQLALDTYAQSWGYSDLVTAASYANSTVPQYAAEAKALIAWRDATWQWAEAFEAQVNTGTATLPSTPADLVAVMPAQPTRPTA
jgi:hypothetical protein